MKRLVVTGGAGFIGSHFVDLALKEGHSVLVLDALTYAGNMDNLKEAAKSPQFRFEKARIQDAARVHEILGQFKPDALINFAAESHVDRSIEGPQEFIETNIFGTYSLLQESLRYYSGLPQSSSGPCQQSFRYLQVSTDEVFGMLGPLDPPFTEKTPYAPSSPYSASKASADHLVNAWHHTYQLPTVITNCTNNYGPRQFPEKLIPHMIQCALSGKPLPVYGKGENIRDWIHVEDHARGVYLAMQSGRPGQSYCFGGHAEKKNLDLVNDLCQILDVLRPRKDGAPYANQIQFVTDRKGHDFRYAIDDAKAESELGYRPQYSFDSGLKQTIEWYLN